MSERMEKILEAGEENRQYDIELGRKLERERILAIFEDMETYPTGWDHKNPVDSVIALIKGEKL